MSLISPSDSFVQLDAVFTNSTAANNARSTVETLTRHAPSTTPVRSLAETVTRVAGHGLGALESVVQLDVVFTNSTVANSMRSTAEALTLHAPSSTPVRSVVDVVGTAVLRVGGELSSVVQLDVVFAPGKVASIIEANTAVTLHYLPKVTAIA